MEKHDDFVVEYGFYAAQVKANLAAIASIDKLCATIAEYRKKLQERLKDD